MQYDTIMNLQFYVFENILNSYGKILEQRREEEEAEAKKQGYDPKDYNPNTMMRNAQKSMPKMPSVQIPKF